RSASTTAGSKTAVFTPTWTAEFIKKSVERLGIYYIYVIFLPGGAHASIGRARPKCHSRHLDCLKVPKAALGQSPRAPAEIQIALESSLPRGETTWHIFCTITLPESAI
ncbi:MAG: hypothetical protein LBV70_05325, partial [Candidatus Adiutrix sp.]|nr:hypothetical protein [Candidatus Adiutrix sp.]